MGHLQINVDNHITFATYIFIMAPQSHDLEQQ